MPRWEVHLSFGLMAFIVILSALLLGLGAPEDPLIIIEHFEDYGLLLLLGGAALILGSIIPDIDGRGRIRWMIGPVAGAFLFTPPFIGNLRAGGPNAGMDYIGGTGSLLFFGVTVIAYLLLIFPMKHRGLWHRSGTGVVFGILWGAYIFSSGALGPGECIMIGSMATLGHWWHIALDGNFLKGLTLP